MASGLFGSVATGVVLWTEMHVRVQGGALKS